MRAWIDAGSGGAVVVVLGVGVASDVAGVAAPDTDGALVAPPLLATVGVEPRRRRAGTDGQQGRQRDADAGAPPHLSVTAGIG